MLREPVGTLIAHGRTRTGNLLLSGEYFAKRRRTGGSYTCDRYTKMSYGLQPSVLDYELFNYSSLSTELICPLGNQY
jgi:hypothetical protein